MPLRHCLLGPVLASLLLALAACVTTTNAPERKVDLKKAEQTHVQAGLGYLRQQDKDSARRHFMKALELNPGSAGAYNGLALVYQLQEEQSQAEKQFRRAIDLDPDFSLARNNYAAFLFAQGRYAEAEQQLQQVVADYDYERRDIALMNLGRTQMQLEKFDEAITSLKQSLGINFRLPQSHLELADLYLRRKDFSLAKQRFDQFSRLARQTPRSLWLGIQIERQLGNKDREASLVLALKNLHPNSAEYEQYRQSIE